MQLVTFKIILITDKLGLDEVLPTCNVYVVGRAWFLAVDDPATSVIDHRHRKYRSTVFLKKVFIFSS